MLDWILVATGGVLLVFAFAGCVVPFVPGPMLGWCALLSLYFTRFAMPGMWLAVAGAVAVTVTVLDSVVPACGARKFKCSNWGVFGCAIGTIAGIFFFPFGLFLGPFLGACIGELVAGRALRVAIKGGFGAFLGFLAGVFLKLCAVAAFAVLFFRSVWGQ